MRERFEQNNKTQQTKQRGTFFHWLSLVSRLHQLNSAEVTNLERLGGAVTVDGYFAVVSFAPTCFVESKVRDFAVERKFK